MHPSFESFNLSPEHKIYRFEKHPDFILDQKSFKELWESHPEDYHILKIHGREVKTPRWQQAYGKNYRYTGSRNNALPITQMLSPFLEWSKEHVDERLNGLLLNWYDGTKKHYIGAHRDDTRDLQDGSPIVTISLGEERLFRMRPYGGKGYTDIVVGNGSILVIPENTNQAFTHEVPDFAKYAGKRISITLRAFK